jgi:hypothetical protein
MRKLMYETHCSRCDRKEMQEVSTDDLDNPETAESEESLSFYATLAKSGEDQRTIEVRFQDLCSPCCRTVKVLLEQIGKHIDGLSPDRKLEKAPAVKKPAGVAKEKTAAPSHGAPSEPNHTAQAQPAKAGAPNIARA